MNDLEILECAQSIHDFLMDDNNDFGRNYSYESFMDIPVFKRMRETLSKYDTDMLPFTKFLNTKYKIYPEPIWCESQPTAKEFFTTKSRGFYKIILRDLKVNLLVK